MPSKRAKTSRPVRATALGLAAVAAVLAGHLAGLDDRAEYLALDMRFKHLSSAPVSDDIVHVDIDDTSLDQLGRWPWPRQQLAGIVDVLQQCGAKAVALDIIMPDPQEVRYASVSAELYAAADWKVPLGYEVPRPVFDDQALTDVLEKHADISLPMHVKLRTDRRAESEESAIDLRVRRKVFADPLADFETVRREVLGEAEGDVDTDRLEEARQGYLRARSLHALGRFAIPPQRLGGRRAVQASLVIPPLISFAMATQHTGFVTFVPDLGGVVRRIPLLADVGGRIYPQFALALAAQELGRRHGGSCAVAADGASVTLRCADRTERVLPVDGAGFMLIHWIPRRAGRRPHLHISAALPGLVWQNTQRVERNQRRARLWQEQLLHQAKQLGQADLEDLYYQGAELFQDAYDLYKQRIAAQVAYQRAALYSPARVPPRPKELARAEADAEKAIDAFCRKLRAALESHLARRAAAAATTAPAPGAEAAAFQAAKEKVESIFAVLDRLTREDRQTREHSDEVIARVRKQVEGKICMIGSTATGAADFVPTPIQDRTPGVEVHANILNTILTGAFVRRSHPAVNVLVILLAGAAVSLLAAVAPVWVSGPLTAVGAAAYAAVNAFVLFHLWSVWLVMVAPVGAMLAGFVVVTAYRQLTEERAKRHIRDMFAHALSPALVDRLIEDPSIARLGGERRVLSCYFSDIAGFTPLAERLGEQQTVRLLNRYFDRMTEVIQHHCGGYLNKFIGDGIFVFFGAPVFQDDHAARAIHAALDCQMEIARFNEDIAGDFDGGVKVACRIGIATGEVMVGNCGSTQRMDYTAIGPTVNLASRLEAANKHFGTRILVADETWRLADVADTVRARPLGRIVVVGSNEPVLVWSPLGLAADLPDETAEACEAFSRGLAEYTRREFASAARCFEKVQQVLPDDRAAGVYLDLCAQHAAAPPGEDWDGVIRLTEK